MVLGLMGTVLIQCLLHLIARDELARSGVVALTQARAAGLQVHLGAQAHLTSHLFIDGAVVHLRPVPLV